tara:strand:+ start:54 stop:371 length:318 start_codon:yes stop_codon:yes gene_type:complete
MSNSNFNFNPALPKPIGFKIQEGQYGNQLRLFIPTESITHLMDHLQNLVNTKSTTGKVFLGKDKGTVDTDGIYVNAKALESEYGIYGQINPQKIENAPKTEELPF